MARTSTSVGTADPGAEDEEHRPVEVPEPGTNERLIADIRATTGEITLPELVDEILSDVVAELASRPAKVFSPMAIRSVTLGSNVDPAYKERLVSAIVIAVHVQPQARRTEVAGLHGDSVKIRLAAPPLDNRANEALVAFVAERFGVARRDVTLLAGEKSRDKRLEVRASSVDPEVALALPAARRGS